MRKNLIPWFLVLLIMVFAVSVLLNVYVSVWGKLHKEYDRWLDLSQQYILEYITMYDELFYYYLNCGLSCEVNYVRWDSELDPLHRKILNHDFETKMDQLNIADINKREWDIITFHLVNKNGWKGDKFLARKNWILMDNEIEALFSWYQVTKVNDNWYLVSE